MSKADEPLHVLVVLDTFGTDVEGVPTTYVKGQTIDARHPSVKRWPKFFGQLTLNHPLPAATSFAAKMAAAKAAKAAEEAAAQAAADVAVKAELETVPVQDAIATPEVKAK